MSGILFTPLTKLLELNFSLNFFTVFIAPVVGPLAGTTG